MSSSPDSPPTPPLEADVPVQNGLRPDSAITAPRVFWPAAAIILVFVGLAVAMPERLGNTLSTLNDTVIGDLGWFYVLLVSSFIAFSLWVALSPMGKVVLGKDDEEPEFGLKSWFAMLFAAGMGIGLVFWGVAEPLNHFASPPPGTADGEPAAARAAHGHHVPPLGPARLGHLRGRRPRDRLRRAPQGSARSRSAGPWSRSSATGSRARSVTSST